MSFLEERHRELKRRATAWADSAGLEAEHDARRIVRKLAEAELLRACVPAAYGGLREKVELRDLVVVRAVLGYRAPFADTMFAMQGLGSYPVTLAGTDAQKAALLPRVATGDAVCAFAVTEPEAGSDVSAISTRARKTGAARGAGWALDGEKCFISNAGIADSYVVFARTGDDRHKGLSAFLVAGGAPGLTVEPVELIAPHPIGTVRFSGVPAALLGEEGGGFQLVMATLDFFRSSVGAAAAGMAARARDEAIVRVKTRRQFGKALAEFQATQLAIADMAVDVAAATLLVRSAAHRIDVGGGAPVDAAMAKLYATEAAQRVIDRSVQLHGGQGLVAGHIVERLYREVRALRIYEGTSEIQRLVIARALLR